LTIVKQGKELFVFERYMIFRKSGGNHCQLNVVPVSSRAAANARSTVESAAKEQGVLLQRLDGPSKVRAFTPWRHFSCYRQGPCRWKVQRIVTTAMALSLLRNYMRIAQEQACCWLIVRVAKAIHTFDWARQGEAGREALRTVVGDGEYFLATLPDGTRLVHSITRGERHPLSFGREVRAAPPCS
jgi:hypothetical protein